MAGAALSELPRPLRTIALVGLAATVPGAGDFVMGQTGLLTVGSANAGQAVMDYRAADWTPYIKPMYWRLRIYASTTGAAAPAQDCYVTVYAVTPSGATAGAVVLGNEVAGIRGALRNLALVTTTYELTGPTVPAPADGQYVAILHSNAAWAANSGAILAGSLDVFAR